jgi:hypothetical protein
MEEKRPDHSNDLIITQGIRILLKGKMAGILKPIGTYILTGTSPSKGIRDKFCKLIWAVLEHGGSLFLFIRQGLF